MSNIEKHNDKANKDWERKLAIFSRVWYLTAEEQDYLDIHSLYRCTLSTFLEKMFQHEEDHCKDKIEIGVVTYTLSYINCSSIELIETGDKVGQTGVGLLISCRAMGRGRNFAAALVQPRYRGMSEEKWNSIRWLSPF